MTAPADRTALVEVMTRAACPGRSLKSGCSCIWPPQPHCTDRNGRNCYYRYKDIETILTAMEAVGVVPAPVVATHEMIDAADLDFPQFTDGDIRMAYLTIAIDQAVAAAPYGKGDGG